MNRSVKKSSNISVLDRIYRQKRFIYFFGLIVAVLLCPVIFPGTSFGDRAANANKRGIEAYNEKNYEESLEYFTEALVERPNSPELKYNRGTALSDLKKTDEALKELMAAAERLETNERSSAAHFNAGNTLVSTQNLEAAIEHYKRAVKLDQASEDYRYNLELAVRMMNQQKQEQEQNNESEEEKEGEEEDKQDETDSEDEQEEEEQDEQQSDKTRDPEEGKQQDQQDQQSQQQDNKVLPMTEEEAQRLLDAINDDEKKALSMRYQQMKAGIKQGDDW
jgi:tetratricopeptide (TPR) repeat protein